MDYKIKFMDKSYTFVLYVKMPKCHNAESLSYAYLKKYILLTYPQINGKFKKHNRFWIIKL